MLAPIDERAGAPSAPAFVPMTTHEVAMSALRRFARDIGGVTSIEYALMAGMIALVLVTAVRFAGTQTSAAYVGIGAALP